MRYEIRDLARRTSLVEVMAIAPPHEGLIVRVEAASAPTLSWCGLTGAPTANGDDATAISHGSVPTARFQLQPEIASPDFTIDDNRFTLRTNRTNRGTMQDGSPVTIGDAAVELLLDLSTPSKTSESSSNWSGRFRFRVASSLAHAG